MPLSARVTVFLMQLAPVLLGFPLYLVVLYSSGNMIFYFVPGLFMVAAGLLVALIARFAAPPGFVRAEAAESLRFHGIAALVACILLALIVTAFVVTPVGPAAGLTFGLYFVALPLIELVRAVVYAIKAVRWPAGPDPEQA